MDRVAKNKGNQEGIAIATKPVLVRKQFIITELQAKCLRDLAHASKKSESELVRMAIHKYTE